MKLNVECVTCSVGGRVVVDGVSLGIRTGEFVGLVGPNGCGKSTLLKNIYRACRPDRGAVYLNGRNTDSMNNREMALEMAVMQQENPMEFDMTVFDTVMLGRFAHQRLLSTDWQQEGRMVRSALDEVGLTGYEERSFLSLSGGEKQRALVARALAQQAPLILLDEPTNHLDIGYQYQIMSILKKQNLTVFSSIHDLNIASCYFDRIILMQAGQIVDMGTPEEMFTPKLIKQLFGVDVRICRNEVTGRPTIVFLPPEAI